MIKGKRGFTLPETLTVAIIVAFILGVIYMVWAICQGALQTGSVLLDIQREATFGMDKMINELYEAGWVKTEINSPYNSFGDEFTFQVPTVDADTGTIYDAQGNINWGNGTETDGKISYLVPDEGGDFDGRLIKRVFLANGNVDSNTVLARYVTTISFVGYDDDDPPNQVTERPGSLHISITTQETTAQGRTIQTELSSQVSFRN